MSVRTPRVVTLVRLFDPWVGGTEQQARKLSVELERLGVDVRIVTGWWFRGTPQSEVVDGVPVFRNHTLWEFFGIKGLRKFGGYLYIITLVLWLWRNRDDYDVVHVHGLSYHTFAAVLARRITRRKVVVKLANSGPASDILRMRSGQKLALSRFMLPTALKCDRFVALNDAVVSELLAAGVDEELIVEIPNGVELPSGRSSWDLHDPVRLVYVGRLHPQKGVDALLRGVSAYVSRDGSHRVVLRLLGDGPDRSLLETLASSLGLTGTVEFVGVCDDVWGELVDSDIFLLPSKAEGLSNALLEAMAVGAPVIVSRVPGNADIIHEGQNGLLVAPGEPDEIANALHMLIEDDRLRQTLGQQARATVERDYDIARTAERYLALYEELTPGSDSSSLGERSAERSTP